MNYKQQKKKIAQEEIHYTQELIDEASTESEFLFINGKIEALYALGYINKKEYKRLSKLFNNNLNINAKIKENNNGK